MAAACRAAWTPLFDQPILEHILRLLRRSGIVEIAVTLQYMPRRVTDYFLITTPLGRSMFYWKSRIQ